MLGGHTFGPDFGPAPASQEGRIFLYDGSDGLYFTVFFNERFAPGGEANWDITVTGSSTDPFVQISDDPGELTEPFNNQFQGRWPYGDYTDGGVIGTIGGNNWTITIAPISYSNLNALKIFDGASGSFINLNLNTDATGEIVLTAVPLPAAVWLFGSGLTWSFEHEKKI